MWPEILSIIAVVISGAAAVCSACVPAILNAKTKKAELAFKQELESKEFELKRELEAEKLKREKEQAYNAKFEVFYQNHVQILKKFSNLYAEWKINPLYNTELLEFISSTAPEFRISTNHWLYVFADKVKNYKTGDNLDKDYERCKDLILQSYGVKVSANTPDYLMSEMLRVVLKERFDELQHSTSSDFHFHSL